MAPTIFAISRSLLRGGGLVVDDVADRRTVTA
jgi:hypothetical protein